MQVSLCKYSWADLWIDIPYISNYQGGNNCSGFQHSSNSSLTSFLALLVAETVKFVTKMYHDHYKLQANAELKPEHLSPTLSEKSKE